LSGVPHVTFVHGIANKPAADVLLHQWQVALLDDDGVDLDAMGVTSSMVYWADMLYPRPAPGPSATEAGQFELEQSVDADDADLGFLDDVPEAERDFVQRLGREVGLAEVVPHAEVDPILPASPLEAVPLPDWLKRRLMRVFLRDVHHYLYDASATPRPGETFQIRRDVRRRAVRVLQEGASRPGPHVVIGHSLGSVIAYDVLSAVDDAPAVDALLTVGSPLGLSEVRDRLSPPWTREGGWPAQRLADGPWSNVFDLLDPVCGGLDRMIAGEFRMDGRPRIADLRVSNHGSWRHSVVKYLGQPRLREALLAALG
jgi:hypothetical protein